MSEEVIEINNNITYDPEFYKLMSIKEACKFLSVSYNKMTELIENGEIVVISGIGSRKVRQGDLIDLIEKHKAKCI